MIQIVQFPHLVSDESWSFFVRLVNNSFIEEQVYISLKNNNRSIRFITSVGTSGCNLSDELLNTYIGFKYKPFSMAIMANSGVAIIGGIHHKQSGQFSYINPVQTISSAFYYSEGTIFNMDESNSYFYYGMDGAGWLKYEYGCLLDYCLNATYVQTGRSLVLGDCCMSDSSDVPGHPEGSHRGCGYGGGKSFDMNYPKIDGGYTFYRPDGVAASSLFENGTFIDHRLDMNTLRTFLTELTWRFPYSRVRMDTRIANYVKPLLEYLDLHIEGDDNGLYGHDNHIHIDLATWEAE